MQIHTYMQAHTAKRQSLKHCTDTHSQAMQVHNQAQTNVLTCYRWEAITLYFRNSLLVVFDSHKAILL